MQILNWFKKKKVIEPRKIISLGLALPYENILGWANDRQQVFYRDCRHLSDNEVLRRIIINRTQELINDSFWSGEDNSQRVDELNKLILSIDRYANCVDRVDEFTDTNTIHDFIPNN